MLKTDVQAVGAVNGRIQRPMNLHSVIIPTVHRHRESEPFLMIKQPGCVTLREDFLKMLGVCSHTMPS